MRSVEMTLTLPTPCQLLEQSTLYDMPVWVKRDDLVHPVVSGNKYRKLKYLLIKIAQAGRLASHIPQLVTMGGLWSNHVHATAYAAHALGYQSLALIRGHDGMHSAMLDDCHHRGMQIQFVDRVNYKTLRDDPMHRMTLVTPVAQQYWLPEGGSDPDALPGVAELIEELPFIPDIMLVGCGTAATLAGLLAGLKGRSLVIGIAVLQDAGYLRGAVSRLLEQAGYPSYQNYVLRSDFHHGGYAKVSPELRQFCNEFMVQYRVSIEPVYTGKVFFALHSLIQSGAIQREQRVMVLHTGGLQGARGLLM